jgi:hypothetical protein
MAAGLAHRLQQELPQLARDLAQLAPIEGTQLVGVFDRVEKLAHRKGRRVVWYAAALELPHHDVVGQLAQSLGAIAEGR